MLTHRNRKTRGASLITAGALVLFILTPLAASAAEPFSYEGEWIPNQTPAAVPSPEVPNFDAAYNGLSDTPGRGPWEPTSSTVPDVFPITGTADGKDYDPNASGSNANTPIATEFNFEIRNDRWKSATVVGVQGFAQTSASWNDYNRVPQPATPCYGLDGAPCGNLANYGVDNPRVNYEGKEGDRNLIVPEGTGVTTDWLNPVTTPYPAGQTIRVDIRQVIPQANLQITNTDADGTRLSAFSYGTATTVWLQVVNEAGETYVIPKTFFYEYSTPYFYDLERGITDLTTCPQPDDGQISACATGYGLDYNRAGGVDAPFLLAPVEPVDPQEPRPEILTAAICEITLVETANGETKVTAQIDAYAPDQGESEYYEYPVEIVAGSLADGATGTVGEEGDIWLWINPEFGENQTVVDGTRYFPGVSHTFTFADASTTPVENRDLNLTVTLTGSSYGDLGHYEVIECAVAGAPIAQPPVEVPVEVPPVVTPPAVEEPVVVTPEVVPPAVVEPEPEVIKTPQELARTGFDFTLPIASGFALVFFGILTAVFSRRGESEVN